ncbi:MAG: AI-2E family transporter [Clostridiaceae bacterium]|nr:AI-2E family transporter [Clostridiaceae bacterium]
MEFFKEFFKKDITKRLLVLLVLIFFMYLLKGMLNLFLMTFLFTYITYSLQKAVTTRLDKYIKVNQVLVTTILYALMFVAIVIVVYNYIPVMIKQIGEIGTEISKFDIDSIDEGFIKDYIVPYVHDINFTSISKGIGWDQFMKYATNVGTWSFNIFVSLILSLFFMVEKDKVKKFVVKFDNSRVSGMYKYIRDFGRNFLNSFGKVIQAQILIAFANSVLSTIALFIMNFPSVLGLGVMIFIFSLVPVAGTIVSLIPLCIIAYTVGGVKMIVYVIILIAVLHSLESYVLNPKFMADKTELPVFFIFITLLVSEHFMGVWGLLLGVPLFMFILDLLNVKASPEKVELKLRK